MPAVLGPTQDSKSDSKPGPKAASQNFKPPPSYKTMGGNGRLDTISKRNHAAAIEVETLLWRALCDSPEAAKEYMADDCIMINPLFAPDNSDQPANKDSDPSIDDILKHAEDKWVSFKMQKDPMVVQIDLMAVALVYKVSLFRQGKKGLQEVRATASSSWRQTAGADWLLCAHHVGWAD